ncbi:basic 7S globulin-like [Cynara cardunculus var. scolymus]|uniref:Aspartic peptidase n=1 Tax=Cynara cardunculus var. scolymus TaxID=59895 RepID=A0A103WST4_CYNCS|nr:basic 7S globulin-like [Cynara cardunculus var. scolymus]KVH77873.1 Aspartic peptidase [Cynara cardunculus var. scolymus]
MIFLLQLIVVVVVLISHEHEAIAQFVPPYSSVVMPVNKHTDAAKPLYSVEIMTSYVNMQYMRAKFLIDMDAPFIWHDCILKWNTFQDSCPPNTLCTYPVSCEEYQCTDVRTTYSYENPSCPPVNNGSTLPGWGYCTCPVTVVDPVTGSCGEAMLDYDEFTVNTSNGRNVFTGLYGAYPNAACAPSSSFASFPANVSGVMALSSSPYAFPAYLYQPLSRIIALCLPSTLSSSGLLFYGNSSYHLLPQSNVDIRSLLSYTPLIKRPGSFGYFIGVNAIVIKTRSIQLLENTTTKLSTIDPYTTMRTDIYKWVVRRFSLVTKRIPLAAPVAPFGLCFSTFTNGTRVSLRVPDIDISINDGKKWSISTANSIKQITEDVACLAFVDGGATSEPAIVIGTFQFEDNFLMFDLENSTFGFSSSLLRKKTSCSNFNFTLTESN